MSFHPARAAAFLATMLSARQARPASPPAGKPEPHTIARDHAGPVTPDTPFDAAAIQALFPGAPVRTGQSPRWDVANAPRAWIEVRTAGGFVTIEAGTDGRIAAVIVKDAVFRGPRGRHVGMAWPAAALDRGACRPARSMLPYVDQIDCASAGVPQITYVFDAPRTALGQPIPYADAHLDAIRWTPETPG